MEMSPLSSGSVPTTAADWTDLLATVETTAHSPYSKREKLLLWCQGVIVLFSGVLYLASLLRRAATNGLWCIKKDSDGYWHPNIHVAIPIITIAHAASQSAGIGLTVLGDSRQEGKITSTVALNLIACSVLYFAGWTKVWAVLYALPSSIFRLRRRDVLGSTAMITKRRILSPRIFNHFILAGYLLGLCPLPALCYTVYYVHDNLLRLATFRATVSLLISQLTKTPQDVVTSLTLAIQAGKEGQKLQSAQKTTLDALRVFSGLWLIVSSSGLVVFLGGSFALILALTRQIEILGKIQRQRAMLLGRPSCTLTPKPPIHPLKNKLLSIEDAKPPKRSFLFRLQAWLPSLSDHSEEDLLAPPPNTSPLPYAVQRGASLNSLSWNDDIHVSENHLKPRVSFACELQDALKTEDSSRKNRKRLISYCVSFAWQAVFCTLIAASYIVLNIVVVFNLLDAPRSISLSQLFRTVEQWAAWSWGGGPGAILGLLACIVAFSRNPSLPEEPSKASPRARLATLQAREEEDDDDEEEYGKPLAEHHVLTVEKLHQHSAGATQLSRTSPSNPPLVPTTPTDQNSTWKEFKSRLGISSKSEFSASSTSRPAATSSQTSGGFSREWSPFQIMSLDSSNIVTLSPARPQPKTLHVNAPRSLEQFAASEHETQRSAGESAPKFHFPSRPMQARSAAHHPIEAPPDLQEEHESVNTSSPNSPSTRCNRQPAPSDPLTGGHFEAIHQLRDR